MNICNNSAIKRIGIMKKKAFVPAKRRRSHQ